MNKSIVPFSKPKAGRVTIGNKVGLQMDTRRIIPRFASKNDSGRPAQRAGARVVAGLDGSVDAIMARAAQCGAPPSMTACSTGLNLSYLGQTTPATPVVQATGSGTYTLTPSDNFLGEQLVIYSSIADSVLLYVTNVKIGICEHVLGGAIPVQEFNPLSPTGGRFPLKKWASPAQGIVITLLNVSNGNTTNQVSVGYRGVYSGTGC